MAKFDRPDALWFVAPRRPDGEPHEHLAGYGISAKDYPPGDPMLARLTDDQIKMALDSGLYQKTKPTDDRRQTTAGRAPVVSPPSSVDSEGKE